ncbi:MAG: hypothetical protein Gyms2KO_33060 [Gymnodinialimonas sp.]
MCPERFASILNLARRIPTRALASAGRLNESLAAILATDDPVRDVYGRLLDVPELALAEPFAALAKAYDLDARAVLCEGSKVPTDARLALLLAILYPHPSDNEYFSSLPAYMRALNWLWIIFSDSNARTSLNEQLVRAVEVGILFEAYASTTEPRRLMSQPEFDAFRDRLRELYRMHGQEAATELIQTALRAA